MTNGGTITAFSIQECSIDNIFSTTFFRTTTRSREKIDPKKSTKKSNKKIEQFVDLVRQNE